MATQPAASSTTQTTTSWPVRLIQTGKLQDMPYREGTWETAIYKNPRLDRVTVSHTGLDGDMHTGNGPDLERAICIHPAVHYSFWESYFRTNFPLGTFGENMTVDGMSEQDVCIGDILRCGSVIMQVSQPRMPCYKQARRIDQPDFVKLILQTCRTGFLVRILEPGNYSDWRHPSNSSSVRCPRCHSCLCYKRSNVATRRMPPNLPNSPCWQTNGASVSLNRRLNERRTASAALDPPRLPRRPGAAVPLPGGAIADHGAYSDLTVANGEFADSHADDATFERVAFKRANYARSVLTLATFIDVRWDTADLAEARWERAYIVRSEFTGCRMSGTQFLHGRFEHVRFLRSNITYARFWNGQFDAARFEQCELRDASFEGSNLAGVVFDRCDLRGADFRETTLRGTDLRGSQLDGLKVGIKDLQGAIIDPTQAVQLAELLGVVVKQQAYDR